jgi:hypothetical protein
MARRSRVLLIALAAALLGTAASSGRALPDATAGRQLLDISDPSNQVSGLELLNSVAGSGDFSGRVLSDVSGSWPNGLFLSNTGAGTHSNGSGSYVDSIATKNLTSGNGTASFAALGLGINSDPTDAIAKPYLWLMDIGGSVVYKIDTVAQSVVGAFNSQPTNGASRLATNST